MTNKSNVIRMNNHNKTRSSIELSITEKAQLLDVCKSKASNFLKKQVQHMFDNVDDFLFDLADKAESNAQQALYFDAMREIRLQKEFIENDFQSQFSCHYKKTLDLLIDDEELNLEEKNAFSDELLDGMLLIQDDELEESLAITNMTSKANNLFREMLYALDQRYSYLLDKNDISNKNNPLSPSNLCESFKTATNRIDSDIKVKLIVYKLFDRYVVQFFGELYDDINKELALAGVLPNIKATYRKNPNTNQNKQISPTKAAEQGPLVSGNMEQTDTLNNGSNYNAPVQNGTSGQNTDPGAINSGYANHGAVNAGYQSNETTGSSLFSTLQGLLSNQREFSAEANNSNLEQNLNLKQNPGEITTGYPSSYQSQDIVTALSLLQKNPEPGGLIGETIKSEITREIGKLLGDKELKDINSTDTDAIDIVGMLFEFILEDNHLPDNIKAQIGRLQIPVLKVAIIDQKFFSKRSHPARQLLNELANAEISLENEDNENDFLFQKIKSIVETIITTFEDDISIFAEQLEAFIQFKTEEQENNEQAREELLTAKITVAKEIGERVVYKIPDSIRSFITEVWKDVLTAIYLRDKKESIGWLTALQVMDDLIWTIQPKSTKDDQQTLVKLIPKVLQGLQEGLTLINFDTLEKETLFQGLQHYHIASLKGVSTGSVSEAKSVNNQVNDQQSVTNLNSNNNHVDENRDDEDGLNYDDDIISDDDFYQMAIHKNNDTVEVPLLNDATDPETEQNREFYQKAKDLELGKWVEFNNENAKKSKGKLVWKSDLMGEYTFVDRKYSIVADKTIKELANDFAHGNAIILADIPLFDRALDAVISGLKKYTEKKQPEVDDIEI